MRSRRESSTHASGSNSSSLRRRTPRRMASARSGSSCSSSQSAKTRRVVSSSGFSQMSRRKLCSIFTEGIASMKCPSTPPGRRHEHAWHVRLLRQLVQPRDILSQQVSPLLLVLLHHLDLLLVHLAHALRDRAVAVLLLLEH